MMAFCRGKEDTKELFQLFNQSLGPKAYVQSQGTEPLDDRTRLFVMYYMKAHQLVKQTIETEFYMYKGNGSVRVVFSTIAFGMGIFAKRGNVMHLGPSSRVDDYLQECGRVGKNNEIAHAILKQESALYKA